MESRRGGRKSRTIARQLMRGREREEKKEERGRKRGLKSSPPNLQRFDAYATSPQVPHPQIRERS